MVGKKEFVKYFSTSSAAARYAEHVGGILTDKAVRFVAFYSYSKARYSVARDKYAVYIKLSPPYNDYPNKDLRLTVVVYADTSLEAYALAREKIEKGVL